MHRVLEQLRLKTHPGKTNIWAPRKKFFISRVSVLQQAVENSSSIIRETTLAKRLRQ